MAWARGTMNLKPGVIRLFQLSKDFNRYTQHQTHAQVWICLMDLPWEYWRDKILREIFGAVGKPLITDSATQNHHFGHYARVLVNMDLSKHIFEDILVEIDGYAFNVEVIYECWPQFCSHCDIIGHNLSN